jgi:cytochrome c peroxidase
VVARPTLSKDLKRPLPLTAEEQEQLVAFLATMSSEEPPRPVSLPPKVQGFGIDPATAVSAREVRQKGRRFSPGAVSVAPGEVLTILNDDDRTHNVRVDDPRVPALSEAQEPGDSVVLAFPELGQYQVICGIHPEMRLDVVVRRERAAAAPAEAPAPGPKRNPAR